MKEMSSKEWTTRKRPPAERASSTAASSALREVSLPSTATRMRLNMVSSSKVGGTSCWPHTARAELRKIKQEAGRTAYSECRPCRPSDPGETTMRHLAPASRHLVAATLLLL